MDIFSKAVCSNDSLNTLVGKLRKFEHATCTGRTDGSSATGKTGEPGKPVAINTGRSASIKEAE